MTITELQDEIASFLEDIHTSVELFILDLPVPNSEGDLEANVYKGRMHQEMPTEIISIFSSKLSKLLLKRDYELIGYNPALTPDRTVIWKHPSEKVPFFKMLSNKFSMGKGDYYDDKVLPYSDIWAIWIKFKAKGKSSPFYIGKRIPPSKVLVSGGPMTWVFKGESFNQLRNDVLTVDNHIDVFVCADTIVFENKQNFEKAMMYTEIIESVALGTLAEIKKIDIVEDFYSFETMLAEDEHSIRKLNRLREKQYFKNKSFSDYHKIIKEYKVAVNVDAKNKKFVLANKAQAKLLIKVLNDDFLKSELTNLKYSANSKEDI